MITENALRRYTNIPALLYLLRNAAITLLDPKTWDDRNDSYFLASYRKRLELKRVLALCFSETNETYHHWRVFAAGSSGVCVRFDRDRLLEQVLGNQEIIGRSIDYRAIDDIDPQQIQVVDLPFLKRVAFAPEQEFRLVYSSRDDGREGPLDVPIDISSINRITLSPWMPVALSDSVKETIRSIDHCRKIVVSRSTLIENETWKRFADQAGQRESGAIPTRRKKTTRKGK